MTQLPLYQGFFAAPGFQDEIGTIDNSFVANHYSNRRITAIVDGSARDSGNTTRTSTLRQGLALGGPIASGGDQYKLKQWDITATDGTQFFYGFLLYPLSMLDQAGSDCDRLCDVLIGGYVYSDYVIIPCNTSLGMSGNNANLLPYMAQDRFTFDKNVKPYLPKLTQPPVTLGASPVTLTAADSGRLFVNTGASGSVTVNIPSPLPGLVFQFMDVVGQNIVITPATTDCINGPGNLAADTVTLTAGTQTGCMAELTGISTTQYLVTRTTGTGAVLAG